MNTRLFIYGMINKDSIICAIMAKVIDYAITLPYETLITSDKDSVKKPSILYKILLQQLNSYVLEKHASSRYMTPKPKPVKTMKRRNALTPNRFRGAMTGDMYCPPSTVQSANIGETILDSEDDDDAVDDLEPGEQTQVSAQPLPSAWSVQLTTYIDGDGLSGASPWISSNVQSNINIDFALDGSQEEDGEEENEEQVAFSESDDGVEPVMINEGEVVNDEGLAVEDESAAPAVEYQPSEGEIQVVVDSGAAPGASADDEEFIEQESDDD